MNLALRFFFDYYPELCISGFQSDSWLFDTRLSLLLDENTNIVKMQRQFYNYPINKGDGMIINELFGHD